MACDACSDTADGPGLLKKGESKLVCMAREFYLKRPRSDTNGGGVMTKSEYTKDGDATVLPFLVTVCVYYERSKAESEAQEREGWVLLAQREN